METKEKEDLKHILARSLKVAMESQDELFDQLTAALSANAELEQKLQEHITALESADAHGQKMFTRLEQCREERAELCRRAESAERALTDERHAHTNMAAQFELIAKGEHPRYWTLEPGDVLFRRDGNERPPRSGEFFGTKYGDIVRASWSFNRCDLPIYRRIEAPADQIADAGKMVPPPVSEQEGERFKVEHTIVGDCQFTCSKETHVRIAAYLNGTSPEHATIREQATEIERLRGELESLRTEPSVDNYVQAFEESTRPTVAPAEASEGSVPVLQIDYARVGSEDRTVSWAMLKLPTEKVQEAVGSGRKLEVVIDCHGNIERCEPAAPAPAAESGKVKRVIDRNNKGDVMVWLTNDEYVWLSRRAEIEAELSTLRQSDRDRIRNDSRARELGWLDPIDAGELAAQLSKYKRDAEAWEAVKEHELEIQHFADGWRVWFPKNGKGDWSGTFQTPLDAVLALAASLSQQEGGA